MRKRMDVPPVGSEDRARVSFRPWNTAGDHIYLLSAWRSSTCRRRCRRQSNRHAAIGWSVSRSRGCPRVLRAVSWCMGIEFCDVKSDSSTIRQTNNNIHLRCALRDSNSRIADSQVQRSRHPPRLTPSLERGPQPAIQPEAIDRRRGSDGADASQYHAAPLEAALLEHATRGRVRYARVGL